VEVVASATVEEYEAAPFESAPVDETPVIDDGW
jgi:hypothetical protein